MTNGIKYDETIAKQMTIEMGAVLTKYGKVDSTTITSAICNLLTTILIMGIPEDEAHSYLDDLYLEMKIHLKK